MALNFLLKRSGTADKRPNPNSMASGEIDLNYDAVTGGVFYKDSAGDVVKVGSAQVSATAPNAVPVGSAGNSDGEFWYDTSTTTLKIWNGSAWVATGVGLDQLINLPLTPLTLTDTVSTPLLSVSASTFRAVIVNISASNDTTGRYHTDTVHVIHNGTGTDLKLIEGAAIGLGPYTVSAALTAGNLVVSVASNSASATKYVGNYQTFAI